MRHVPENRNAIGLTYFITLRLKTTSLRLDLAAGQLILDTIDFYRSRGDIECYGFVIMPDHAHLVVKMISESTLPQWMSRFKSYVARQLGRGPIWQRGYWSEVVPDISFLEQKLRYIHENPARAGLAQDATDYGWSSARDYYLNGESKRIDNYR